MATLYTNFRNGFTGAFEEIRVANGRVTEPGEGDRVDLGGRWMLPAFVDSHCHILPAGLDLQKLHLGGAMSQEEVLDRVRDRHRSHPDGWLQAVHYDQNRFPGGRHLSREDLDAISADRPISLRHVNGHASVVNSAALQAAGIDESTPEPEGGEFVRDASGRLTGVLLENAHEIVSKAAPGPTIEEMTHAILLAGERMREVGIVCAADMMTGHFGLREELEAYREAATRGCKVGTRLYIQWRDVFGRRAMPAEELNERIAALDAEAFNGCRVAGVKIFADGAIGSATAAIYGSYAGQPERETSGQLIYSPERLNMMVRTAHEAGYSIAVHTIGDYATDLVMDAFANTEEPSRHRIEHAMLLSDAQIERMASLGCSLTFQPEFLLRFGHTYQAQLGEERASKLMRTRSVLDAGIPLSFNSDRPITGGDPWDGIRIAESRTGFDPNEKCTRLEAIRAYTVEGSRVDGDGDMYGSLALGSFGEFNLYDESPLE